MLPAPAAAPAQTWRKAFASWWHATFFYQLTLAGPAPQHLSHTPPPAYGNPQRGQEILNGQIICIGRSFDAEHPLWLTEPGDRPGQALHAFEWLDDLAVCGVPEAQLLARDLVLSWLDNSRRWHAPAWEAAIAARRLTVWLTHARFVCPTDDDPLWRTLLLSLARHARHISRTARNASPGLDAFAVARALLYAGRCGFGEGFVRHGLRLLADEVSRQILPDGGQIQRSPGLQLRCLSALVDCQAVLDAAPQWLIAAIENAGSILRLFRLNDGSLGLFNGTGREDVEFINHTLRRAGTSDSRLTHAKDAGFIRMAAGQTIVLMDVGASPAAPYDVRAHAGTLSFEMSCDNERVIVNCGTREEAGAAWNEAARTTAAHSTMTFADTNSSEILPSGIGRRPRHLPVSCDIQNGEFWVTASHDGYRSNFGLVHRRRLYLSADGQDLRGEDSLIGAHKAPFTIRFHLHPDMQVSLVQNSAAALLRAPSGAAWRMQVSNAAISITESVYLAGTVPVQRTEQIVLSGYHDTTETIVKWALRRAEIR